MQRTPGQMPVDSHSRRLRDPTDRNPNGFLRPSFRLVEQVMEVVQVICFAERSVCRQTHTHGQKLPRLRISQGRERHLDDDESTRLCTGSARDLYWQITCPDQVKLLVPQRESQSILAMGWFRFTAYLIIYFACPFGFWEIIDVYIPRHKVWPVRPWALHRGCSRVSNGRSGRGGCIWTLSVWSFMHRCIGIRLYTMVVCKVCEIDAVSLLPEGSFALACKWMSMHVALWPKRVSIGSIVRYRKHVTPWLQRHVEATTRSRWWEDDNCQKVWTLWTVTWKPHDIIWIVHILEKTISNINEDPICHCHLLDPI